MIFYSAEKHGFYISELHVETIPDDAREISHSRHAELLNAQANGQRIVADVDGYPICIDHLPTHDELADAARAQRNALIDAVKWRYERHAREVRLALPLSEDIAPLDVYIQALADVPGQPGFPDAIQWPDKPI